MVVEEKLKAKMDRSKVILGTIDYTKQGINLLAADCLRHIHTLERYGTGSAAQVYTAILELKMTKRLREEWANAPSNGDIIPNVADLIKFAELKQRIIGDTTLPSGSCLKPVKLVINPKPCQGMVMHICTSSST